MTGRPSRLSTYQIDRLTVLWPDPEVKTKAICQELRATHRTLQNYAKKLGLGYRPDSLAWWHRKDAAA
jgi:hypothetical protein